MTAVTTVREYRAQLVQYFTNIYREIVSRVGQVETIKLKPEEGEAVVRYWRAIKPGKGILANEPLLIITLDDVTLEVVHQNMPTDRYVIKVLKNYPLW